MDQDKFSKKGKEEDGRFKRGKDRRWGEGEVHNRSRCLYGSSCCRQPRLARPSGKVRVNRFLVRTLMR